LVLAISRATSMIPPNVLAQAPPERMKILVAALNAAAQRKQRLQQHQPSHNHNHHHDFDNKSSPYGSSSSKPGKEAVTVVQSNRGINGEDNINRGEGGAVIQQQQQQQQQTTTTSSSSSSKSSNSVALGRTSKASKASDLLQKLTVKAVQQEDFLQAQKLKELRIRLCQMREVINEAIAKEEFLAAHKAKQELSKFIDSLYMTTLSKKEEHTT